MYDVKRWEDLNKTQQTKAMNILSRATSVRDWHGPSKLVLFQDEKPISAVSYEHLGDAFILISAIGSHQKAIISAHLGRYPMHELLIHLAKLVWKPGMSVGYTPLTPEGARWLALLYERYNLGSNPEPSKLFARLKEEKPMARESWRR